MSQIDAFSCNVIRCPPQMRCFLFGSFTPPQVARAYLAAYPGSIDVVALVKCGSRPCPLLTPMSIQALAKPPE